MATPEGRFGLNVHRSARAPAPTVHVFVQRLVRQANGMLAVTPVCGSLPEIEREIEEMREELDEILRQARQAFGSRTAPAVGS